MNTGTLGWGLYEKAYALALIGDERLKTEGVKAGLESIRVLKEANDKPNGLLARSFLALVYDKAEMYDEAVKMVEKMAGLIPNHIDMGNWIHGLFPVAAQVYLDCICRQPNLKACGS